MPMNENYSLKNRKKFNKKLRKLHLIIISKPSKNITSLIIQYSYLHLYKNTVLN